MNIENISIKLCATDQTHFGENGIWFPIFVSVGQLINRDIILNCNLINNIEFLCKVLAHEIEHIILEDIFDHELSVQYDNVYEAYIPDCFEWLD